jgi:hypothetical protein
MVIDFVVSDSFCVPGDGLLTVLPLSCTRPANPGLGAAAIPAPLGYAAGNSK